MIEVVEIYQKENGFSLTGHEPDPDAPQKEMVVEGRDPKKIGAAVLSLFQKPKAPRKPREKKEVSA